MTLPAFIKKFLAAWLFLGCLYILPAQVPGYMGKRFVAGYGLYTSPALLGATAGGKSMHGNDNGNAAVSAFAFNSMHQLYAEYAVKRGFSLGCSATFYRTSYDNGLDILTGYRSQYTNINGNPVYLEQMEKHPEGFYQIRGINYSLYGKAYFRKYLAPWGRYFMFGPTIRRFTCIYSPDEMKMKFQLNAGSPAAYYNDFGPTRQSFTRLDLMAGFGRSRIIADKIVLDYGFSVNAYAVLTLDDFLSSGYTFAIEDLSTSNYIHKTSARRVREMNRFNVFLKVGVLLF